MLGCNFLDTPIPYQDLPSTTMPMSPMNLGVPSYLGGVQMRGQLDADKIQIMNKKEQEGKKTLKIALTALALIGAACFAPSLVKNIGKSFKNIKNGIKNAGGIGKYLKNLFNKPPKPPKTSFWAKTKTAIAKPFKAIAKIFKRKP